MISFPQHGVNGGDTINNTLKWQSKTWGEVGPKFLLFLVSVLSRVFVFLRAFTTTQRFRHAKFIRDVAAHMSENQKPWSSVHKIRNTELRITCEKIGLSNYPTS